MTEESVGGDVTAGEFGPLDVRLAVDVDAAAGCPLSERDLDSVRQSLTRSAFDDGETCQVAINNEETCHYQRTPVEADCPCAILERHDCITDVEAVRAGTLVYSLLVPGRDTLRDVVSDLRAVGATVTLERVRTEVDGPERSADGVALTRKQREALASAIEAGYYEQPREASLDDLADELDLSPSGVSQRLNAVERKLVYERARVSGVAGD